MNRHRLRNRIYLGIFPLLLLMLGMVVFMISVTADLSTQARGVAGEQRQVQNLAYSIRESLHVLDLSGDDPEEVDAEIDTLRGKVRQLRETLVKLSRLEKRLSSHLVRIDRFETKLSAIRDRSEGTELDREKLRTLVQDWLVEMDDLLQGFMEQDEEAILSIQERTTEAFFILTVLMVLAACLGLYVSFQLSAGILQPIEQLNESIEEVSRGNFDVRLPQIQKRDELSSVIVTFGQMLQRLKAFREAYDRRLARFSLALRTLLDRMPDVVFIANEKLEITYANPQAEELFHAREWREKLPEELQERLQKGLAKGRVSISRRLDEALLFRVNGEDRHYLVHVLPLQILGPDINDDSDTPAPSTGMILQDVTLMHLADRLKSSLVATVSHELKTPLASARMCLYLLAEQQVGKLNEGQLDLVTTAKDDLDRQLATIQNLLDLSRIDNESEEVGYEEFALEEVVRESHDALEDMARGSDVELQLEPPEQTIMLWGNRHRILVVVNNFITNAIKYTSRRSTVTIRCRQNEQRARVEVSDKGPGIEADKQRAMFDPFVQGTARHSAGGSGLGLHIAKKIIEEHGGKIGCHSEPGEGSTFFFELPVSGSSRQTP